MTSIVAKAEKEPPVIVSRDGSVTIVRINRPFARNAVNNDTARALVAAFEQFDREEAASVAILTGTGGAFCAGGDLKEVSATGAREWLEELNILESGEVPRGPMGPSRMNLSKPVIAAVSGPATAGGTELALWCDIRVMEESAYFGIYCRRWGIPLLDGGTVRMPRLIGQGRAMEIILSGRKVDAEEALRIGMCEKVVPDGQGLAAAIELARLISSFPQDCVRADLASVKAQYGRSVSDALQTEWYGGVASMRDEGVTGATRFVGGAGRGGRLE